MSIFVEEKDRKVIPVWRKFSLNLHHAELSSTHSKDSKPDTISVNEFEIKLAEWKTHRSIAFASDFVGTAITLGYQDNAHVKEAAQFIHDNPKTSSRLASAIALNISKPENASPLKNPLSPQINELRNEIKLLKKHLLLYTHDAIAWVNLSRTYTCLGQPRQAERAMRVALHIAPNNRFILRTAVRLFIHIGEHQIAHDLLINAEATPHDPWLMSAEIASASIANKKPRYIKRGINHAEGLTDVSLVKYLSGQR